MNALQIFSFLLIVSFASSQKNDCRVVFCPKFPTPEECLKKGLAYSPRDGVSHCCTECLPLAEVLPDPPCADSCYNTNIKPMTIQDCTPYQVLVPANGVCFCADSCIDRQDLQSC